MAEAGAAAGSARGRAAGQDAGPSGQRLPEAETGDREQQFERQELLECQMETRAAAEGAEDAGLVAEAEAVAAGWMLDFLCLSLCRAFRDSRLEDFQRIRDSAEGECGARPGGAGPREHPAAGSGVPPRPSLNVRSRPDLRLVSAPSFSLTCFFS